MMNLSCLGEWKQCSTSTTVKSTPFCRSASVPLLHPRTSPAEVVVQARVHCIKQGRRTGEARGRCLRFLARWRSLAHSTCTRP
jgi:hypothetical protein